jgi:hypothetical protein
MCTIPSLKNSYAKCTIQPSKLGLSGVFYLHSENLQQKEKRIAALTLELNADGDMIKDGVSVLTLDGLHLDHKINNT